MIHEHFYANWQSLIDELTLVCQATLEEDQTRQEQISFLVSGGNTPLDLYRRLSATELGWAKIHVALVDERWVDVDDRASNERSIRQNLLVANAANATFTGMKNLSENAALGLVLCEAGYAKLPRPFSLMILGMGNDGHVASLFPHASGLEAALEMGDATLPLCAAIRAERSDVTGEFTERLSLTVAAIKQSRRIILLLRGQEKLEIYRRALAIDDWREMPVAAVLAQQDHLDISVYWSP